jgi:uncharacterized repeat protein (TIGR02543 family)
MEFLAIAFNFLGAAIAMWLFYAFITLFARHKVAVTVMTIIGLLAGILSAAFADSWTTLIGTIIGAVLIGIIPPIQIKSEAKEEWKSERAKRKAAKGANIENKRTTPISKEINLDSILNSSIVKNDKKTVDMDSNGSKSHLEKGEVFLKLSEFESAESQFRVAIENDPSNWRCWFGLVKCYTKNFTDIRDVRHESLLQKAKIVASESEIEEINNLYASFSQRATLQRQKTGEEKTKRNALLKNIAIISVITIFVVSIIVGLVLLPKEHTITFDARGGTLSSTSEKSKGNETIYLPYPTRTGYTFRGWYTSTDWTVEVKSETYKNISLNNDIKLYARWSQNQTVTITESNYKTYLDLRIEEVLNFSYTQYRFNIWVYANDNSYLSYPEKGVRNVNIISVVVNFGGQSRTFSSSTYFNYVVLPVGSGSILGTISYTISGAVTADVFEKKGGGW